MSLSEYSVGVLAITLYVGAQAASAICLRRTFFASYQGALSWIATWILGLALTTLSAEVLGSFGAFARWPLVGLAVAIATLLLIVTPRGGTPQRIPKSIVRDRAALAVTVVFVGVVVGQSVFAAWRAAHSGILDLDSLQYHLSDAAYFVSSHHTDRIYLDNPATGTPYYPFNDELLHGVGMALLGRDSLTLVIGFGDIFALLLVVWQLFYRHGEMAAAAAVAGTAVTLVTLGSGFEPSGLNDWHGIWLLLAAALLAIRGRRTAGGLPALDAVLCGVAAGMAAGTKLSLLVPVVALSVLVAIFAARGKRVRTVVSYMTAAVSGGGYWFGRDIVRVHNPLPELNLSIGSWRFPRPPLPALDSINFSVLHYATDRHVVAHYFIPGLKALLGPLWPLILMAAFIGLIGGVVRRPSPGIAWLALLGCVAGLAYLVTPTGAGGPAGAPVLFAANVRYSYPAVVVGLGVFPLLVARRSWALGCSCLYLAFLASVLSRRGDWADGLRLHGAVIAVGFVVIAAFIGLVYDRRPAPSAVTMRLAGAVALTTVAIIGYPLQQFYLHHRYANGTSAQEKLFASLQPIDALRVGIVGSPLGYPFFGTHWQNQVSYVGRPAADHGITDIISCAAWRSALTAGHYGALVIQPYQGQAEPRQRAWTVGDSAARQIFHNSAGSVFLLDGSSAQDCPPA